MIDTRGISHNEMAQKLLKVLIVLGLLPLWGCNVYSASSDGKVSQGVGRPATEAAAASTGGMQVFCPGAMEQPVRLDDPPGLVLTSDLPGDVYPYNTLDHYKPPKNRADLLELRAWYRNYAWQLFTALNWPLDKEGVPRPDLADPGVPRWTTWRENYELYTGAQDYVPEWSLPRQLHQRPHLPPVEDIPSADMHDRSVRILFDTRQAGLEAGNQQEDHMLWDQNGDRVFYQVVLNDIVFNTTAEAKLYTIEGQIKAYEERHLYPVSFSYGSCTDARKIGSIALKFAWKVLRENDHPERYLTMDAWILSSDDSQWEPARVGLVGMHVAQKTLASHSRWLWSTFEQVDNVRVDDEEVIAYASRGEKLAPSFTDPQCPTCAVNVPPEASADGLRRTQVSRVVPIPQSLEKMNLDVRKTLAEAAPNAPWQYYELVGIQFASDQSAPAAQPEAGPPISITQQGGGNPDPTYLVNATLETYDQIGNQPVNDLVPGTPDRYKDITVFGTQSCMGCHVSAGLVVSDEGDKPVIKPGIADYHFQFGNAVYLR